MDFQLSDDPRSPRTRALSRKAALWTARSTWETRWREIAEFQQPHRGRFTSTDTNVGTRKDFSIYDNTATKDGRILASGLMSGMTSPARPWFKTKLADAELMEYAPVKTWLHKVDALLRSVFASSNTYNALAELYLEVGVFGTCASFVEPNFERVMHHHVLTIGEYALAQDNEGKVNTLVRPLQMTVAQMVRKFGLEKCSPMVRDMFARSNMEATVEVIHMIEPRSERDPTKRDAKNMPFSSIWFEPANSGAQDNLLLESGFKRFPALAARWETKGGDAYGHSPGMECQGDVKQLQFEQLKKGQAIDYKVSPPLQVPTSLKGHATNRLPGGITYYDSVTPGAGIRSLYEVNLDLSHLREDIMDVRDRIHSSYYRDLFLMLSTMPSNSRMTATEVAERHEEKLLMLGPTLERLHSELLSPMIDMAFDFLADAGVFTGAMEPPPELQDMDMEVEFISVLAQAQRAVAAAGADRLVGTVANLAALKPDVLDKVDFDQVVDDYAEMFGVNPEIILDDDRVAAIRDARAKQQAQMQAAAMAQPAVETAKTASEIDQDGLGSVMDALVGYNTPGVVQ